MRKQQPEKETKKIPVTVENFVRAESDAYFKTYATGKGRELDVDPNRAAYGRSEEDATFPRLDRGGALEESFVTQGDA
jgi:hypothetical protein